MALGAPEYDRTIAQLVERLGRHAHVRRSVVGFGRHGRKSNTIASDCYFETHFVLQRIEIDAWTTGGVPTASFGLGN